MERQNSMSLFSAQARVDAAFEVQHLEYTKPFMLRKQCQVCRQWLEKRIPWLLYPSAGRFYQLNFMYTAVVILFVLIKNNFLCERVSYYKKHRKSTDQVGPTYFWSGHHCWLLDTSQSKETWSEVCLSCATHPVIPMVKRKKKTWNELNETVSTEDWSIHLVWSTTGEGEALDTICMLNEILNSLVLFIHTPYSDGQPQQDLNVLTRNPSLFFLCCLLTRFFSLCFSSSSSCSRALMCSSNDINMSSFSQSELPTKWKQTSWYIFKSLKVIQSCAKNLAAQRQRTLNSQVFMRTITFTLTSYFLIIFISWVLLKHLQGLFKTERK